jgi:hypothetical protein
MIMFRHSSAQRHIAHRQANINYLQLFVSCSLLAAPSILIALDVILLPPLLACFTVVLEVALRDVMQAWLEGAFVKVHAHKPRKVRGLHVRVGHASGELENLLHIRLVRKVRRALLEDNEMQGELALDLPHQSKLVQKPVSVDERLVTIARQVLPPCGLVDDHVRQVGEVAVLALANRGCPANELALLLRLGDEDAEAGVRAVLPLAGGVPCRTFNTA